MRGKRNGTDSASKLGQNDVIETTLAGQPSLQAVDDGSLSPVAIKRIIRDWCGSKESQGEYQAVCYALGTTPYAALLQMLISPVCPLPPRVQADMLMELTRMYLPRPAQPVQENEDGGLGSLSLGGFTITAGVQAPNGQRAMIGVHTNKETETNE